MILKNRGSDKFKPIGIIFFDPFLYQILAPISWVVFHRFFVIFGPHFGTSIFDPFFHHFTGGRSPGSNLSKNVTFWDPDFRFLLYSSVYIFRSERSAPRGPKKWPFLKKAQPICGEWRFYRADLWGRKWGEFLQKSDKFQKIYVLGSRSPEVDFWRFWPPHGISTF
jgi:hypothetical protein